MCYPPRQELYKLWMDRHDSHAPIGLRLAWLARADESQGLVDFEHTSLEVDVTEPQPGDLPVAQAGQERDRVPHAPVGRDKLASNQLRRGKLRNHQVYATGRRSVRGQDGTQGALTGRIDAQACPPLSDGIIEHGGQRRYHVSPRGWGSLQGPDPRPKPWNVEVCHRVGPEIRDDAV